MANVTHSHANCSLSYQANGGVNTANLRCKQIEIDYSVNSEESHARQTRAFYPHRRSQGSFSLTFDFIHYAEFSQAMKWFQDHAKAALNGQALTMHVVLPARQLDRQGVPVNGIAFGDHIGSMVFSPTIQFTSFADANDPSSSYHITAQSAGQQAQIGSSVYERAGQTSTQWFYPDSQMMQPGAVQTYLYDQVSAPGVGTALEIITAITGVPVTPPAGTSVDNLLRNV